MARVCFHVLHVNTCGLLMSQRCRSGILKCTSSSRFACVRADMCNVYSDFASMYCPASKCPLARPGADCKPASGRFMSFSQSVLLPSVTSLCCCPTKETFQSSKQLPLSFSRVRHMLQISAGDRVPHNTACLFMFDGCSGLLRLLGHL